MFITVPDPRQFSLQRSGLASSRPSPVRAAATLHFGRVRHERTDHPPVALVLFFHGGRVRGILGRWIRL